MNYHIYFLGCTSEKVILSLQHFRAGYTLFSTSEQGTLSLALQSRVYSLVCTSEQRILPRQHFRAGYTLTSAPTREVYYLGGSNLSTVPQSRVYFHFGTSEGGILSRWLQSLNSTSVQIILSRAVPFYNRWAK